MAERSPLAPAVPESAASPAARGAGAAWSRITDAPLDLAALQARVTDDTHGAVAAFVGIVRNHHEGRAVTGIDYEAYGPMAEAELARVVADVRAAVPGVALAVEHRVGTLTVGEASVAIAAAHARRAPAIRAMERTIEELKRRVPVWKREHYVDGTRAWVDPTAAPAAPSRADGSAS